MFFSRAASLARTHRFITLLLAGAIAFGAYFFFRSSDDGTVVSALRTATVEKTDLQVIVTGSGQVEADSQVDLKPVVAGDAIEVTTVAVQNDQEVKKGQVIAVLDNQDAWRDVAKAELDVHQAKVKEKQTEDLYPKRNQDDTRQRQIASASVAQSEIALQKVRDRLQDYTIRAPFDGIVTGLTADSGDTISQTGVLASVITKKLHLSVALNEVDAAKVKEGNVAKLTFVALPGITISGKVSKLDTIGTVTQNVVSYGAEIELAEQPEGLKPGMSATADIMVAEKIGALTLPNAAITTSDGKAVVTIISSGVRARPDNQSATNTGGASQSTGEKREVVVGLSNETVTELVSGISEGTVVELSGATATSVSGTTTSGQGSILNLFRGSGSGGNNRTGNFSR